ncbi:hypothetical protein K502DRAFT_189778 [Neoconidiobolus thromboides FSU 785]|nr:hypothetical protein K502DRAFT_189778 [Neoconidiobolus thromboides FSU 785]
MLKTQKMIILPTRVIVKVSYPLKIIRVIRITIEEEEVTLNVLFYMGVFFLVSLLFPFFKRYLSGKIVIKILKHKNTCPYDF